MGSVALGGTEGVWVRYWDEGSTVAHLEFEVKEPVAPTTTAPAKEEKKKKKDIRTFDYARKEKKKQTTPLQHVAMGVREWMPGALYAKTTG